MATNLNTKYILNVDNQKIYIHQTMNLYYLITPIWNGNAFDHNRMFASSIDSIDFNFRLLRVYAAFRKSKFIQKKLSIFASFKN